MGTPKNTSPATEKLVAAIEALLELVYEGRMDELTEEEQEAVKMADEAISETRN